MHADLTDRAAVLPTRRVRATRVDTAARRAEQRRDGVNDTPRLPARVARRDDEEFLQRWQEVRELPAEHDLAPVWRPGVQLVAPPKATAVVAAIAASVVATGALGVAIMLSTSVALGLLFLSLAAVLLVCTGVEVRLQRSASPSLPSPQKASMSDVVLPENLTSLSQDLLARARRCLADIDVHAGVLPEAAGAARQGLFAFAADLRLMDRLFAETQRLKLVDDHGRVSSRTVASLRLNARTGKAEVVGRYQRQRRHVLDTLDALEGLARDVDTYAVELAVVGADRLGLAEAADSLKRRLRSLRELTDRR